MSYEKALNRIGLEPVQTFFVVFNATRDDMITVLEETKGQTPWGVDMESNLKRVSIMVGKLLDSLDALRKDDDADR